MSDRDAESGEAEQHKLAVPGFGPPAEGSLPVLAESSPSPGLKVRNVVLVLGGVALVAIVLVVVLVWLFLTVIRGAVDDVESNRNETAITAKQYAEIREGTAEADVRELLGKPEDVTTSGSGDGAERATTCLYYNEKDAGLVAGDQFKFCFISGELVKKQKN